MDWNNITIKKYLKIQDILTDENMPDEEKIIQMANVIYEEDITELTVPEFNQKIKALDFVKEAPKKEKLLKSYTINGTKYNSNADIQNVQANQFIDFQNYAKKEDTIGCISCFFIPDGHKYNDGYDMLKTKEDIGELPITVANGLAFFFKEQYVTLLVLSNRSSLRKMKEMGMDKEKLEQMAENLATIGTVNLVFSLTSSNSVK